MSMSLEGVRMLREILKGSFLGVLRHIIFIFLYKLSNFTLNLSILGGGGPAVPIGTAGGNFLRF